MKARYYKPTGKAMASSIDWLCTRRRIAQAWHTYVEDYGLQDSDLIVEDGKVTGLNYEPALIELPDSFSDSWKTLPSMPSEEYLGTQLGVQRAQALYCVGVGTIVAVLDDSVEGLAGHTELTKEELANTYDIHIRAKDCPKCGLMLSFDEKRCHRCGKGVA